MSNTQQPEALNLEEFRAKVTHAAREPLLARIAELEAARIAYASEFKPDADGEPDVGNIHANIRALKAQLSAIGAGGVEPLRKQASTADVADERDAFEKWLRIKPCGAAHDFGWEAWKARAAMTSNKKGAKK